MKSNSRTKKKSSKVEAANPLPTNRTRVYSLLPMFVGMITCAVFLPSLSNDFLNWDDDATLITNPIYRRLGCGN